MDKEFSSGALIFRKEKQETLFLLIYSGRNKIWGFPKGHLEPGESEKEAATREIMEETGIKDLRFVDGFREEDVYKARSNKGPHGGEIEKHSIYLLCETRTADVVVDAAEITNYQWLGIYDAEKLLNFDSLRRLLRKAETFAHITIPKNAKWKRVAISYRADRYVLDSSNYKLPYYVVWRDFIGEHHELEFVVPGAHGGIKDTIDTCFSGPYHDYLNVQLQQPVDTIALF